MRAGGDDELAALLDGDLSGDAELAEALTRLMAHPAMAQAQEQLRAYVDRARAIASALPAGSAQQALVALSDFVLARTG